MVLAPPWQQAEGFERARRKWSELAQGIPPGTIAPGVLASLMEADLQRIRRGSPPYTGPETQLMLISAQTGEPVAPKPRPRFLSRVRRNMMQILQAVPWRLPQALLGEAASFGRDPSAGLRALVASGASPRERVHGFATAPGWRFLPGAYVAETVAGGYPEELWENPLFTLLDVAPYGAAAARAGTRAAMRARGGAAVRPPRAAAGPVMRRIGRLTGTETGVRHGLNPFDARAFGYPSMEHAFLEWASARGKVRPDQFVKSLQRVGVDEDGAVRLLAEQPTFEDALRSTGRAHARKMVDELTDAPRLIDEYRDWLLEKGHDSIWDPDGRSWNVVDPREQAMGAGLRELTAAGYRHAELAVVDRWPTIGRYTPSELLDRIGVGPRMREMSRVVSIQDRRLRKEAETWMKTVKKELVDDWVEQIPRDRMREITRIAERGDRGWWNSLSDAERAWLRHYQDLLRAQRQQAGVINPMVRGDRGKLFMWDGEWYSIHDSAHLWRAYRRLAALQRAQAKATKPDTVARLGLRIETATNRLNEIAAKTPPARYMPRLSQELQERMRKVATLADTDAETLARILRDVEGGIYNIPGIPDELVSHLAREVRQTWRRLRDVQGVDPLWVHHVTESGLRELRYPRITPQRVGEPSQVKRRALDMRPWADDISVALQHQGVEWLIQSHTEAAVNAMRRTGLIRPADDIARQSAELLSWKIQRGDLPPKGIERYRAAIDRIIQRDWVRFEPGTPFPFQRATVAARGRGEVMPRKVAQGLEQLQRGPSGLLRYWDKALNAFRISVLSLSPGYYGAQVIGDQLLAHMRTPYPDLITYWGKAQRMLRDGELPPDFARGLAEVPPEIITWQMGSGRKIADMLQLTNRRLPDGSTINSMWSVVQWINDANRAMVYVAELDKAAARGVARPTAHRLANESVNRTFQNWDVMTPLERTSVRYIFPFYSWYKYIGRYLGSYPIDHPVRSSVMMNMTRAELADWSSGLPEQFYRLFFLGEPDEMGNVKAVSLGGPSPFFEASSLTGIAGWLSRLNPGITGGLQALGLDPFTYTANLFGDVEYDPVSGRLVRSGPGAAATIPRSFIPQIGTIQDLFFATDDLKVLKETNPQAFKRRILSGLGLRGPFGAVQPEALEYNIYQQLGRAEQSRLRAFRSAFSAAERGDVRGTRGYPELEPFARWVRSLYA